MQQRLKWSILALAQPAAVQLTLFPDFVCVGDEMALNFEQGLEELGGLSITETQRDAIDALDRLILSLSGESSAELWTDSDALREDARWNDIRASAKLVADAFGWPTTAPLPTDDTYIRAK